MMYSPFRASRWPMMVFTAVLIILVLSLRYHHSEPPTPAIISHMDDRPLRVPSSTSNFLKAGKGYNSKLQVKEADLSSYELEAFSKKYDIAYPEKTIEWTEQDLKFFKTAAGEAVFGQLAVIPEEESLPNFPAISNAERLFKSLFLYFDRILANNPDADVENDPRLKESWRYFKRLESALYPWIHPYWENTFHINNQTSGRGIVICVGNKHFDFAVTTLRTLREYHHNTLPIEVFYVRDSDLSETNRAYLTSEFDNLTLRRLEDYVSDYYTKFGGWAMKPFAMVASKFSEIIMMDADVYFFQDPALLFNDKGYKATGSLFFYDRTLFPNWTKGPNWIRSFISTMSPLVQRLRGFRGLTSHEMESGVVVTDKRRSLLGLLSVCKLNSNAERTQVVYKRVYGDKETFWIGFEVMQTAYSFIRSYGAVVGTWGRGGTDGSPENICGTHLHLDADEHPMWLNSGLYRDKFKENGKEYLNFTHFAQGNDWDFKPSCIKDTDKIRELSPKEKEFAFAAIEFDKQRAAEKEAQ